jgi:putative inorganic carbon (HCO3(-)) transporter
LETLLLAVVVALVPLILTPGLLYYFDATPKLIVLLTGTAAALPFLFPRPPRAGTGRVLFGLIALQAVSLTLSTVFSRRPELSLWGSNWRNLGLISQGALLLLTLLVFSWIAGRPERLKFMLRAIAVCGSLAAAYGILQYFGWDPWLPAKAYQAGEGIFTIVRPPGTMGHADYFANYLLFVIFAGAALAMNSRGAGRAPGVLAAVLGTIAIVLSGTRGAWMGGLAGALYLLLQVRPRFSWRTAILCAVVLVAAAGFYFSPAGFRLRSRIHWIGEDVRGGGRLLLWRDSLRLAAGHWIAGAGPESFPALFPQFQSEELARAYPDFYYESPHNLFLDVLIAQGPLGVVVLLGWIALGLRAAGGRSGYAPYLGAALVAGMTGHLFSVFILTTALYFYLTVAMLAAADAEPVITPRRWLPAPVSAAMIFLALRMLAADRSLELARRHLESGRTVDAIAQYRIARARGLSADVWYARSIAPFAVQEALDAATGATAGEDAQNAAYTVAWLHARTGDVRATEQSLRASVACSPNWYKPHWMLGQILRREGRAEEARTEAERAVYLSAGKNPELDATAPNR